MEKYCRTAQATNDSIKGFLRFPCWVKLGYKHTLSVCNTHCLSTATMVARTRLSVTLYAHCLFFSLKLHSLQNYYPNTRAIIRNDPYGPDLRSDW